MPDEIPFYESSNGDRWILLVDRGSDEMQVHHRPNRASGGQPSTVKLHDFLSEGHGPQHEALIELLKQPSA